MDPLFAYWGKADGGAYPPADAAQPDHHPLAFHALDVATVGQVLLGEQRQVFPTPVGMNRPGSASNVPHARGDEPPLSHPADG